MSPQEKEHYLYQGEHMTYPDEVSRRLLHEVNHGGIFLAQKQPRMSALIKGAYEFRKANAIGLTTLGSHATYKTPFDKAVEDTVELVTMRMMGEDHLSGYLAILGDNQYDHLRRNLGLLHFKDKNTLWSLVDGATSEALTTFPPQNTDIAA
jgi:hypothetical protein